MPSRSLKTFTPAVVEQGDRAFAADTAQHTSTREIQGGVRGGEAAPKTQAQAGEGTGGRGRRALALSHDPEHGPSCAVRPGPGLLRARASSPSSQRSPPPTKPTAPSRRCSARQLLQCSKEGFDQEIGKHQRQPGFLKGCALQGCPAAGKGATGSFRGSRILAP
eukprot:CAMPEP_0177583656 /NCGR_PEP_ID=MMETSP0419_2-20121207/3441_1 /TAXON_ID=582737 /ORGANISM="Tetraselmis sp., Strain GSL018" /LENGTH=163 /DNA_ID=CAMNT_0019073067 /DNA_START=302 /DNA_END=792 /DNA_ORIENTATION=-